ncbi:MAG: amino acid permease [Pirellulaceae bacterium]
MSQKLSKAGQPTRQLTMFDTACIIVGIIIGAGIFRLPATVAGSLPSTSLILTAWLAGGLLALLGALCYAELTTTYPEPGGDYVYLTRAYGPRAGFLFVWAEFWIIRPGSTGPMAFIFGEHFKDLVPLGSGHDTLVYAILAILVITGLNMLGVRAGKWTQNLLTVIKVLALVGIFLAAFAISTPPPPSPVADLAMPPLVAISFAMLMVMFCFGGWNDVAFVAAEVRRPDKNLLRSLLLGVGVVTAVYLLVNIAYLHVLGVDGLAKTKTPATDMMRIAAGHGGERLVSALVCVAALGAINGMIFTGARIYYAMGRKLSNFGWLAHWNKRMDAPLRSIGLQSLVILGMVIGFGLVENDFERLVIFTAPCFWLFLLLVGVSLFILRWRDAGRERVFRVPGYPVIPLIFCLSSLFMFYSTAHFMIGQLQDPELIGNPAFQAILVFTGLAVLVGIILAIPRQKETVDG